MCAGSHLGSVVGQPLVMWVSSVADRKRKGGQIQDTLHLLPKVGAILIDPLSVHCSSRE